MKYSFFTDQTGVVMIDNYLRHKTHCGIRKLTVAFVYKIGVFSRFSWSLDFSAKMAEFPLPVLQIWRPWKRVAIQIQLMNIHVSDCKCYCLHLVPKFGDVRDHQNWRLYPTARVLPRHGAAWGLVITQCGNLLARQHPRLCSISISYYDRNLALGVLWSCPARTPSAALRLQSAKLALARHHWPVNFLSGQRTGPYHWPDWHVEILWTKCWVNYLGQ